MEAYVRSTGEDNRGRAQLRHAPLIPNGYLSRINMKQAVTCVFALALGFAMGFAFRVTDSLGFLEWVMALVAIAGMAVGYYIRGIEPDDAR